MVEIDVVTKDGLCDYIRVETCRSVLLAKNFSWIFNDIL